jgi:hypothetical protein
LLAGVRGKGKASKGGGALKRSPRGRMITAVEVMT